MKITLIKPTVGLEHEYNDMIKEWMAHEDKLVPWVLGYDANDFSALIEKLDNSSKGIGLKDDMVPHSTYWLINEENRILGAVNIRHRLNEKLLRGAGHIGYGIRPSERRRGHASEALRQALEIVKGFGVDKALVVCHKTNIGSARTIQKNGGVLENEVEIDGETFQRYWIDIR